jgi:8-oxo-dGTP pyrophosphatase MutT (NUDIX family)
MAGNYVFPGGTVEPYDDAIDQWKAHIDVDLSGESMRLGGDLTGDEALAHGVAAIRETFEEAGVFLGQGAEKGSKGLKMAHQMRVSGGLPKGWLYEMVVSEGWTLALTNLSRWSHWITPVIRSRRFDTRFFVAFMPKGQESAPDTRETTHGIWVSPKRALAGNLEGEIPLSPPTLATLHELSGFLEIGSLRVELECRPWGKPRLPRLVPLQRGALLLLPWDPMYDKEFETGTKGLEKTSMPIGEAFSRLWFHGGIWRPTP